MKDEKITCAIARDLMPLVIDDACSQDSREAVEDHMAGCEPCAQYFREMMTAIPVRTADEKAVKGFQRSLRGLFLRFRRWQIIAVVLAVVLVGACLCTVLNPQYLHSIQTQVPVAWIGEPQLMRTEQGVLLLRFTPDEHYRHFFYGGGYSGKPTVEGCEYRIHFGFTLLEKLLNRDFSDGWYQMSYNDDRVLHLPGGDWAVPMPLGDTARSVYFGWRYQDGSIMEMTLEDLTQEDIVALLDAGIPVDGNTQIYGTTPLYWDDGKLTIYMSGPDGDKQIYQSGDEIPLCDPETQEIFDQWITKLVMPGDVAHDVKC